MVAVTHTVAFEGIEARDVEVQCAVSPGLPGFSIVGLPDKAVSEARERVRAALSTMAIALPSKKITINLSPADIPKEGSHFDLPIALALLAEIDILPRDKVAELTALGELALDGGLVPVLGALPAAMAAAEEDRTLICPLACGAEAAWVGACGVFAPRSLAEAIGHITGRSPLPSAVPGEVGAISGGPDMAEVKGQERAKRALEIAAAGRHHLLMVGAPGSGKSMLAARLPGLLPPLTAAEALETSMVHSLAGLMDEGGISRIRPFREPTTPPPWPPSSAGAAPPSPARSALRTTASSSWTNSPNSPGRCWKPCASPSRPGRWSSPAPTPMSAIPAGSC